MASQRTKKMMAYSLRLGHPHGARGLDRQEKVSLLARREGGGHHCQPVAALGLQFHIAKPRPVRPRVPGGKGGQRESQGVLAPQDERSRARAAHNNKGT